MGEKGRDQSELAMTIKRAGAIFLFLFVVLLSDRGRAGCDEAGIIETTTPAPPYNSSSVRRHLALADEAGRISNVDLVALGDSIVQLWPDDLLKKTTDASTVFNLGVGYDRIQNTMWRLLTGKFDHLR